MGYGKDGCGRFQSFLTRSAVENTHATRRDAPQKFFGRVLRLKTRARRATSKGKIRRWDMVSIKEWAVGHGNYRSRFNLFSLRFTVLILTG